MPSPPPVSFLLASATEYSCPTWYWKRRGRRWALGGPRSAADFSKSQMTFEFDNLPSRPQTHERQVAPNSSHFKQRLFCLSWLPRPNCAELGKNSAQLGQWDLKKKKNCFFFVFVLSLNCGGYKHIDSPLLQRLAIQHGWGGEQQGKRKLAQ